jgi:hypothetical protein
VGSMFTLYETKGSTGDLYGGRYGASMWGRIARPPPGDLDGRSCHRGRDLGEGSWMEDLCCDPS